MLEHNGRAACAVKINGQICDYFAGNNYLGLANHPGAVQEAIKALEQYGISTAASRETTGSACIHNELESALAEFKNADGARAFASGYLSNRVLLQALLDDVKHVFIDENSHPSLYDALPRERVDVAVFKHRDSQALEDQLRWKDGRSVILTDGVFPLTGEIAPLAEYIQLTEIYNGLLVVDDAHGTGVLGENGRGTPEYCRVSDHANCYQSETMSKALGAYGGFISADHDLIDKIRRQSSAYIGSTALPPVLAAAGIANLRVLAQEPERRQRLKHNIQAMAGGLRALGYKVDDITPIFALNFEDEQDAASCSAFLESQSVVAPSVVYPGKTGGGLVRMTVSSEHSEDQINHCLQALSQWRH